MKAKGSNLEHKERLARNTLRKPDPNLVGGLEYDESFNFLKKLGYKQSEIDKIKNWEV